MVKIHGLIWLAIGAIVTAASAFLGDRLRFFFWVGLVMVTVGVFKLITQYVLANPDPKTNPLPTGQDITLCSNCRESVYTTARFCHMCGARISHT